MTHWLTFNPAERPQDKWDCHAIRRALAQVPDTSRVVVFAAGPNVDQVERLGDFLAEMSGVVLILTADEQSIFPIDHIDHPNIRIWQQTPHQSIEGVRTFGFGAPDAAVARARHQRDLRGTPRLFDWAFVGQVTHQRRHEMYDAAASCPRGMRVATEGFARGGSSGDFYDLLLNTKIAPCPAGAATPDTFRVWEALEMGCVPIVDALDPQGREGYWDLVFPDFPIRPIRDWSLLPEWIADLVGNFKAWQDKCLHWYWTYQLDLIDRLRRDVAGVS